MKQIINFSFDKSKSIILIFITILILGSFSYTNIPKESSPEVPIPQAYVSTTLPGISPNDAERLLLKPLETELSSIEGLKLFSSSASEGHASVSLEFEPGYKVSEAIENAKDAVDKVKPKLPDDASEPTVTEINTALFPILTVILSSELPESRFNILADELKDNIEQLSGVLEVDIGGSRDEIVEIIIKPHIFETYNLSFNEIIQQVQSNNRLIAAGKIKSETGNLILKAPGLIENVDDIYSMPIKVRGDKTVKFSDVADIRKILEEPNGFARINGERAISLEIKKKVGSNIISTIDEVKQIIDSFPKRNIFNVTYLQDESEQVKTMLSDLENNVAASVILVMLVIIFTLGFRSSILVGLSIPSSFLSGVILLYLSGFTMNIVVLFALILVVGLLVDAVIVTTEYAERKLIEGESPENAFKNASKRMSWPIIASTATTLCVFLPLLFWEETVGQFMKYLPITILFTLSSALFMALVFIPVLGSILNRNVKYSEEIITKKNKVYEILIKWVVINPIKTLVISLLFMGVVFQAYIKENNGVSFFPSIEPDFAQVQIKSKDNISLSEKDIITKTIEDSLLEFKEIKNAYARSFEDGKQNNDQVGVIQVELIKWSKRKKFKEISEDIRELKKLVPGVNIQVQEAASGPGGGKPISLRLISNNNEYRQDITNKIVNAMQNELLGFTDITTSIPSAGVEWNIDVNREKASKYGASITSIGETIKLLTEGVYITDYTPDSSNDVIDIVVRFPKKERTLANLLQLKTPTNQGMIPIENFVDIQPANKSGLINRYQGNRTTTIEANIEIGFQNDKQIEKLQKYISSKVDLSNNLKIEFSGEAEDQKNAMQFLVGAFGVAILIMFIILVTQFNSIWQSLIVMSAIIFSIIGVLLGLMITGSPFGIVMSGIGIIALAGIVVNNNIILIDTFNEYVKEGRNHVESAIKAGQIRLRPVLLTSITTTLGLIPMVLGMNINFFERKIEFGSPSTQWWTELSTTIAGGLIFSTAITLLVTPALLVIFKKREA
jgi:multidrug efflux pump